MMNNKRNRKNKGWNLEERYKEIDQEYTLARYYSSQQATSKILSAAMNDEVVAQAYVAILYHHGCAHVEQNLAEAQNYTQRSLEWMRSKVEKNNNKYVLFLWGCCLADGRFVMKNIPEAIKILTSSARLGLASAKHSLALLFLRDSRPNKNRQGHDMIEQLADENSHPDCQFLHANAQCQGLFVPRDLPSAFQNFKKAARQGHRGAIYAVGQCYHTGTGTDVDPARAAAYFNQSASYGDPLGLQMFAKCCKEGHGVPQNYATSVEYYMKLAARGDGSALHNVGLAYELGRGVKRDREEALRYYRQAVEVGHGVSSKGAVYRLEHAK